MYPLIVVDDEDITRMAVSGYIQKHHREFQVKGAFSNGTDALKYLNENPVSVVITDIRMPRMDGLELSRHIYEQFPSTIVIIISGYSEFEYAKRAITYGVANYLLKPLDFKELSENLARAAEKLEALSIESNVDDEEIQLFFTDIIGGLLNTSSEIEQRFQKLPLKGVLSDYNGCLMTLTLEKNDSLSKWTYGKEKLAMALQNGMRMILSQYEIYHLFRSGMRFYFIILSADTSVSFSCKELSDALYHLLHFCCTASLQSSFNSISALSVPALTVSDVADNARPELPKLPSGDDDIVIQKAMTFIQAHYSEDLTREDVADAVFLSSAYFSRFFKQKTGLSFIDYLTTVRMQKAIELLGTKMKVGDIARKVGYQSRNRFFINFRQYSGYNPTEYRRQILRMEDFHEENEE